jgi:hypothetical protein
MRSIISRLADVLAGVQRSRREPTVEAELFHVVWCLGILHRILLSWRCGAVVAALEA